MQHVFIVGSKGIPAAYGGFETFVEKLTEYRQNSDVCYHVSRLSDHNGEYEYNNAKCFDVKVPNIGPAKAIYYDVAALSRCIKIYKSLQKDDGEAPIFYVLACRIGPFIKHYVRKIHKLGGLLYVNPDGHEWKRSKWSAPVRKYWKISEKGMVKHADLLICDSKNIERYIQEEYKAFSPKTTFLAYGAEMTRSTLSDDDSKFVDWLTDKGLAPFEYYLIVGRFVPENNYETMIREFMASRTDKKLAIITTANDNLYQELNQKLHFEKDERIRFVGTVYDGELLKKIREQAYGYLHGHEVGGTNPSLLEALDSTRLNLLLKVGFNEEVGESAALYWTKEEGNLAALLETADALQETEIEAYDARSTARIKEAYSWSGIVEKYERLWYTK